MLSLQLLEQYVLAKDKESVLAKLIPGSTEHDAVWLLRLINRKGIDLSPEQKLVLHRLKSTNISFRLRDSLLLLEAEGKATQAQREEAARFLAGWFGVNFNFERPQKLSLQQQSDESSLKYESRLDQSEIDRDKLIAEGLKKEIICDPQLVSPSLLDETLVPTYLARANQRTVAGPFFLNTLIAHMAKHKDKNYANLPSPQHLLMLTADQLILIKTTFPDVANSQVFAFALFSKVFSKQLEEDRLRPRSPCATAERIAQLTQMRKWLGENLPSLQKVRDEMLLQILQLGIKINKFDFPLYLQFLENCAMLTAAFIKQHNSRLQKRHKKLGNVDSRYRVPFVQWKSQESLHDDYLQAHFQQHDSIQPFDKYFQPDILTKKLMRSKLLRGQAVEGISAIFSQEQLRQVKEDRRLTLASGNREYFKSGDEISLQLETKNIGSLQVMVYELDMLNYYRKHMAELDEEVRLEGLIPGDIQRFSYSEPPVQLVSRKFTFEKLRGRRGVFVVEFVGGGLSSRAILRLGKLVVKQKLTVIGHVFELYDEGLQRCKGPSAGIYVENAFIPADQHGEVVVPFRRDQLNCSGVAHHQGVSSLVNLRIKKQQYELQCVYAQNSESMLLNGTGKLLVKPRLLLNGHQCSFSLIQSARAEITKIDNPSVASSSTIDPLPLSRSNELLIEFEVGPKICSVQVKVEVEVKSLAGQKVTLSNSKTIDFNLGQGSFIFAKQYLRKNQDGYFIEVLGKNGQPKRGLLSNITLLFSGYHNSVDKTLQTDAKGRIYLGPLKNVRYITSSVTKQGDITVDQLAQSLLPLNRTSRQSSFQLLEGEPIQLPRWGDQKEFILLGRAGNSTTKNLTDKIEFKEGKIEIAGLEPGCYQLIQPDNSVVNFQVIAGKRISPHSLVSKDCLITPVPKKPLFNIVGERVQTFQNTTVFRAKAIGRELQLARCHIFATNFYNQEYLNSLVYRKQNSVAKTKIPLLGKGNSFFSDKYIGDQLKYAMQRKYKTVFIGNTLQKPTLLLKREFEADTNTQQENVTAQTGFKDRRDNQDDDDMDMDQKCYQKKQKLLLSRPRGAGGAGGNCSTQICKLKDFLGLPGITISNVKPDANGLFSAILPPGYSCVTAVFINQSEVLARQIGLPDAELKTRDLRHKQSLEPGKYYSLKRTTSSLNKGSKFECKDVTATEVKMIDSLGKLFSTIKSLLSSKGMDSEEWQKWAFLTSWEHLQIQQKNDKYNQFCCNQLNLFLYFNDPQYFEQFVKPFLANKLKKKFIDHVLLQNAQQVLAYLSPALYSKLDSLQKVLLVRYLANSGRTGLAAEVVAQIQMNAKLVKIDKKRFKVLFDTVLNVCGPLQQQAQEEDQAKEQMRKCRKSKKRDRGEGDRMYLKEAKMMKRRSMAREDEARYTAKRQQSSLMKGYSQLAQTKMYKQKQWSIQYVEQPLSTSVLFYLDLAKWLYQNKTTQNFLSANFIHFATLRDAFAALVFSDIPSKPACGKPDSKDKGIQISMEGNAIAFQKELCPATRRDEAVTIFQKFFDNSERLYQDEEGQWVQNRIQQFLVNKIYGCQVIVTNNTVNPCELDVLGEIPEGAIPVNTVEYTRTDSMVVPSFTTKFFEYNFYFPAAGRFGLYPANASKDGVILAAAATQSFEVSHQRTKVQLKTISDILEKGTKADILEFIATRNILNPQVFNFADILYLLKDKDFYSKLLQVLRRRKVFDRTVWAFGYFHLDLIAIREHLQSQKQRLVNSINYFKNSIVTVSAFEMKEFYPLVNQRAHPLKQRLNILNTQLRETYRQLLVYLQQKPEWEHSTDDKLQLAYFLTLQDRVKEAIQVLGSVKEDGVTSLQHDYFKAYFDFYVDYPNFKTARALADKYLSYPIISWRNLFYDVANHLAEFDGEKPLHKNDNQGPKHQERLQFLEAALSGSTIQVSYKNLQTLKISYYLVDLQLTFTRNPLISEGSDDFSFVKPAWEQQLSLKMQEGISVVDVAIPQSLASQNCNILVSGKSKRATLTYFATTLKVLVDQEQGQLKVVDSNDKPLTKTYIKVVGQENSGRFVFFKDGYTDLRGRFDYVTKSRGSLANLKKFALFVLSEEHGSVIKEVGKPSGTDQVVAKVELVGEKWGSKAQHKMQEIQVTYNRNRLNAKRK